MTRCSMIQQLSTFSRKSAKNLKMAAVIQREGSAGGFQTSGASFQVFHNADK